MARAWINGRFCAANRALVPAGDRSFLYGDGLFETIRVVRGSPVFWLRHWRRLSEAAERLAISIPFAEQALRRATTALLRANRIGEGVLRITVSRGIGRRGYSPIGALRPIVVLTAHPLRSRNSSRRGLRLVTASIRLQAGNPLARYKTNNKLSQVLARHEADQRGADEALMLNTRGYVAEAASANLFWIEGDRVFTPPLGAGILAGITRELVLELCAELGIRVSECNLRCPRLLRCGGAFLTSSIQGITAIRAIDGISIPRSLLVRRIRAAHVRATAASCAVERRRPLPRSEGRAPPAKKEAR